MTTSPTPPETAPAPAGAVQFVATDRTARRLGLAVLRYRWTRPLTWLSNAVIVVALIAFGVLNNQIGVSLLLLVLVFPVLLSMQFLSTARQLGRLYQRGTVHWVQFGDQTMTVAGPLGVSDFDYRTIDGVWATDAAVLLRMKALRSVALMPAELFPPAELTRVRERITQAGQQ